MAGLRDARAVVADGGTADAQRLRAVPEPRVLHGGAGEETLHGGAGDDAIYGGGGSDVLVGLGGDDLLVDVASGAEWVVAKSSRLYGGNGDDRASAVFQVTGGFRFGGAETLAGGDGDDVLQAFGDVLARDVELAMVLAGGDGNDHVGSSLSVGGRFTTAIQHLSGGDGDDRIAVGLDASADFPAAFTTVSGGLGDDVLRVDIQSRALFGATAQMRMWGGAGDDVLDLRLAIEATADAVTATLDSALHGGPGDDLLRVAIDKPPTRYETVQQRLDGGAGNDTLVGSALGDQFVLRSGDGEDRIVSFQEGTDVLALAGGLSVPDLAFVRRVSGTLIRDDQDRALAFVVGVPGLQPDDFILL